MGSSTFTGPKANPQMGSKFDTSACVISGGAIIASSIIKIDEVITVTGTLKPAAGIYEVKTRLEV